MLLEAVVLASSAFSAVAPCTEGPQFCLSAFTAELPAGLSAQERSDQGALYSTEYLSGLLGVGSAHQYTGHYKGNFDGRAFREKHPEKLAEALALFGYRYLEFQGSILQGFEVSHIAPRQADIPGYNKYWWRRFDAARGWWYRGDLGFADTPGPSAPSLVTPCPLATIKGYLSPNGMYGHMAAYPREFVITEFVCASESRSNNSSKPTPLRGAA